MVSQNTQCVLGCKMGLDGRIFVKSEIHYEFMNFVAHTGDGDYCAVERTIAMIYGPTAL